MARADRDDGRPAGRDDVIAAAAARIAAEALEEAGAEVKEVLKARLLASALDRISELGSVDDVPDRGQETGTTAADIDHTVRSLAEGAERDRAPRPSGSSRFAPDERGLYLYGVAAPGSTPPDAPGIDPEQPVRLVPLDGVDAIVSPVRLADFDEDSLEGNLDDLAWLSEKATAHDRVLVRALETGAVLPLRFGTIFHDEEQLRRTLRGHQDLLVTALAGLRGRAEWDVKVTCRPAVLGDWVSERVERNDSAPTADSAGPGAAFMRQKRMERVLADEADRVRAEVGADVTAVMATHAEEMAAIRSSGDPSSDIEILRRDAYLVPEPNREAFLRASEEVAARYAARGIGIHVSGPLPPYHFASIHLREQADA